MNIKKDTKATEYVIVSLLHRQILAAQISNVKLGSLLGVDRRTIAQFWKKGEMPLSDYLAICSIIGVDPSVILQLVHKNNDPQMQLVGHEN